MSQSTDDQATRDARMLLASLIRRQAFDKEAVDELAAVGEPIVPALEEEIATGAGPGRKLALRALAAIGTRSGIATLLNAAAADRERDADAVAVALRGAIRALGPDDADRVGPFLASFADHADALVRAAAVDGILAVRATQQVAIAVRLAGDEDEFVADRARAAADALGAVVADDEETATPGVATPSLLARLASRKGSIRLAAVREVIGRSDGPALVLDVLRSEHESAIYRSAIEAAAHMGTEDGYPALRYVIETPSFDAAARVQAFRALALPARVGDGEASALVGRFVATRDPFVRAAAAVFGLRCRRPSTTIAAARALSDDEAFVREEACRTFMETPSVEALPFAVARMESILAAGTFGATVVNEWAWLATGVGALYAAGADVGSDARTMLEVAARSANPTIRALAGELLDPTHLPGPSSTAHAASTEGPGQGAGSGPDDAESDAAAARPVDEKASPGRVAEDSVSFDAPRSQPRARPRAADSRTPLRPPTIAEDAPTLLQEHPDTYRADLDALSASRDEDGGTEDDSGAGD